jgi:hypothetical protein
MDSTSGALSELARSFVVDQLNRLRPHEFLTIGFSNTPLVGLEIGRTESNGFEVRVPPRLPSTPLTVPMRNNLVQAGFTSSNPADPLKPWIREATDVDDAIQHAIGALHSVFDVTIDDTINLVHGSHQAEHEAAQRLDDLRARVAPQLATIIGYEPNVDAEGDFICPLDRTQVVVAPRVVPGAIALVRVIAITNTGVNVSPDLGLMLARLNFGLMFGRFALDTEHRAILFDETLLGEDITEDELRFTIDVVAETTSQWDTRFQQMFGGRTQQDFQEAERQAVAKPGHGATPSPYL